MVIIKTDVRTPFAFCQQCDMLEVESRVLYTANDRGAPVPHVTLRTCGHEEICKNAVSRYKMYMKNVEARSEKTK